MELFHNLIVRTDCDQKIKKAIGGVERIKIQILQSELYCRAYKLYSLDWHFWQPLQYCKSNFLVPVESPLT